MADTSTNPTPDQIATWVQQHYGYLMSPWQADLLKRLLAGDQAITARPAQIRVCRKLINEATAVISAGPSRFS